MVIKSCLVLFLFPDTDRSRNKAYINMVALVSADGLFLNLLSKKNVWLIGQFCLPMAVIVGAMLCFRWADRSRQQLDSGQIRSDKIRTGVLHCRLWTKIMRGENAQDNSDREKGWPGQGLSGKFGPRHDPIPSGDENEASNFFSLLWRKNRKRLAHLPALWDRDVARHWLNSH